MSVLRDVEKTVEEIRVLKGQVDYLRAQLDLRKDQDRKDQQWRWIAEECGSQLQSFKKLLDDGVLVRDISKDENFDTFSKQGIRIVEILTRVNQSLVLLDELRGKA